MGGQQSQSQESTHEDFSTSFCYYDAKAAHTIGSEHTDSRLLKREEEEPRKSNHLGYRFRRRTTRGGLGTKLSAVQECEGEEGHKILIVGESGVGKTSLVQQLTEHTFSEFFIPTIGRDCREHSIDVDGQKVLLQIWDTGGQSLFRTIRTGYYKRAVGVMIVYSATNEKSFNEIEYFVEEVDKFGGEGVKKLLVANRIDESNDRAVNYTLAKRYADQRHMQFVEVSAKDGTNVELAFRMLARELIQS